MSDLSDNALPSGREYLSRARKMESECEKTTDTRLAQAGVKSPECLTKLGELLVEMDALASCYWGCHGGDHRFEYLAGRIVSTGRASLGLLRKGFYDESFNLSRSLGELANLLFLFTQDAPSIARWGSLDEVARRKEFSPVKVRLAIEAKELPVPIDQDRYSSLSEVATHVGPHTRPNAHMPEQRPRLGGYFDLASALAALNELAGAFAIGSFSVAQLIDLPKDCKRQLLISARDLLNVVGGVSLFALREGKITGKRAPDAP